MYSELNLIIILEISYIALLGLALGSFATALIYRVPKGIPWAWNTPSDKKKDSGISRSACPVCDENLNILDLFPVFSWLFLRGKCRHCSAKIPKRYLLVELAVLLASLLSYVCLGFGIELFFVLSIIPFLCALIVIDFDHMILPDQLVAMVGVIGLVRLGYLVSAGGYGLSLSLDSVLVLHVWGAIFFAVISWGTGWLLTKILKRDALGFGDVKFFAVAGLWLGLSAISSFYLLSGALGVILGVIWCNIMKQNAFPFGPALIASLYVLLLLKGSFFF